MDDSDDSETVPVDVVFSVQTLVSSEDPPIEDWSSLEISLAEENKKKMLYNDGLYDPGSREICGKYITTSTSSVLKHPYYNYPPITDPGIEDALLKPECEIIYPDDGQALYLAICKEMNQCPVRIFHRGLLDARIDLQYYCINPNGCRAMAKALQYNKIVQVLNLTDNFLNDDACYHIGNMLLTNSTITEINLRGCRIGPPGARQLFFSLHHNRVLKVLDLSYNKLGDGGMEHLAKAVLVGLKVENLNLSYNNISGKGVALLVEPFETHNNFTHLDLSWNTILTPGGVAFLTALSESTCLEVLNLSWNGLSGPRITLALSYILRCPRLKELNLSNNMLKAEGISNLLVGLGGAKTLTTLNLSYNPMTPSDALSVLNQVAAGRSKVRTLLMDNVLVTEDFLFSLQQIKKKKSKKNLVVTYGGIIRTFIAKGPDVRELLLNRIDFVANKKPKKNKFDIALMALQLQKDNVQILNTKQLTDHFLFAGAPLDDDLIDELVITFPGPSPKNSKIKTMDVNLLVDYIKRIWPERQLPPTPSPEQESQAAPPEKGKGKGKGKI